MYVVYLPRFSGFRRSNLELSTETHRLSSHVAVLQASLENFFYHNSLIAYSTLVDLIVASVT